MEPFAFFCPAAKEEPCYAAAWLNASYTQGPCLSGVKGPRITYTRAMNAALFLQKPFCAHRHPETVTETLMIEVNAFGDLNG